MCQKDGVARAELQLVTTCLLRSPEQCLRGYLDRQASTGAMPEVLTVSQTIITNSNQSYLCFSTKKSNFGLEFYVLTSHKHNNTFQFQHNLRIDYGNAGDE